MNRNRTPISKSEGGLDDERVVREGEDLVLYKGREQKLEDAVQITK